MDIMNFGNMLNSSWGTIDFVKSAGLLVPQNVSAVTPGGAVRPTFGLNTFNNKPIDSTFGTSQTFSSTYYMQFGFRYNFQ
jgi:hypothetical protein